jgi:hypothetical protein
MPLYFLDVVGGESRLEDPEGGHLDSIEAAYAETRDAILEMVANDVREGKRLGLERRIEIRDEQGKVIAIVAFGDVVRQ